MMSPNYQCRGELLVKLNKSKDAEAAFEKAIQITGDQQSKGWELRAMLSLARLWRLQGKNEWVYQYVDEIYSWFTEGFETSDLLNARVLLKELH